MLFKNKTNQPEITTNNTNLYLGGMYGLGNYSKAYAVQGFKLAILRKIDLKALCDDSKEAVTKRMNELHKDIAKDINYQAGKSADRCIDHFVQKRLFQLSHELPNSRFADHVWYKVEPSYRHEEIRDDGYINSAINNENKGFSSLYKLMLARKLWQSLSSASLERINIYETTGKYRVIDGYLYFGDRFNLEYNDNYSTQLTLPHTYKTEVLGSGLEVIDNKYLTITLTPYDSIIKDCQMHQAELLKVKKLFKDSEIEQAYIAKLDDQVVIAKTHEQLMRKVIKVKEAVKDSHSQAA
ncbi:MULTISPECIES: hypothetical protein [Cysteiniphilum]|uniref:hypothetical protein n=1 Tax=Cysteiniphilum TaxID=2056696 RepID=UPI00178032E5|nr:MULTISPECIES: hypothetical protein [Cysteiniphilum]